MIYHSICKNTGLPALGTNSVHEYRQSCVFIFSWRLSYAEWDLKSVCGFEGSWG